MNIIYNVLKGRPSLARGEGTGCNQLFTSVGVRKSNTNIYRLHAVYDQHLLIWHAGIKIYKLWHTVRHLHIYQFGSASHQHIRTVANRATQLRPADRGHVVGQSGDKNTDLWGCIQDFSQHATFLLKERNMFWHLICQSTEFPFPAHLSDMNKKCAFNYRVALHRLLIRSVACCTHVD
jgi:hypothetical protein